MDWFTSTNELHERLYAPTGIAGVLGDRPAVLAWQVSEQAAHERPGPPAQVHPSEPTCDPAQHLVELLLPAGRVYV